MPSKTKTQEKKNGFAFFSPLRTLSLHVSQKSPKPKTFTINGYESDVTVDLTTLANSVKNKLDNQFWYDSDDFLLPSDIERFSWTKDKLCTKTQNESGERLAKKLKPNPGFSSQNCFGNSAKCSNVITSEFISDSCPGSPVWTRVQFALLSGSTASHSEPPVHSSVASSKSAMTRTKLSSTKKAEKTQQAEESLKNTLSSTKQTHPDPDSESDLEIDHVFLEHVRQQALEAGLAPGREPDVETFPLQSVLVTKAILASPEKEKSSKKEKKSQKHKQSGISSDTVSSSVPATCRDSTGQIPVALKDHGTHGKKMRKHNSERKSETTTAKGAHGSFTSGLDQALVSPTTSISKLSQQYRKSLKRVSPKPNSGKTGEKKIDSKKDLKARDSDSDTTDEENDHSVSALTPASLVANKKSSGPHTDSGNNSNSSTKSIGLLNQDMLPLPSPNIVKLVTMVTKTQTSPKVSLHNAKKSSPVHKIPAKKSKTASTDAKKIVSATDSDCMSPADIFTRSPSHAGVQVIPDSQALIESSKTISDNLPNDVPLSGQLTKANLQDSNSESSEETEEEMVMPLTQTKLSKTILTPPSSSRNSKGVLSPVLSKLSPKKKLFGKGSPLAESPKMTSLRKDFSTKCIDSSPKTFVTMVTTTDREKFHQTTAKHAKQKSPVNKKSATRSSQNSDSGESSDSDGSSDSVETSESETENTNVKKEQKKSTLQFSLKSSQMDVLSPLTQTKKNSRNGIDSSRSKVSSKLHSPKVEISGKTLAKMDASKIQSSLKQEISDESKPDSESEESSEEDFEENPSKWSSQKRVPQRENIEPNSNSKRETTAAQRSSSESDGRVSDIDVNFANKLPAGRANKSELKSQVMQDIPDSTNAEELFDNLKKESPKKKTNVRSKDEPDHKNLRKGARKPESPTTKLKSSPIGKTKAMALPKLSKPVKSRQTNVRDNHSDSDSSESQNSKTPNKSSAPSTRGNQSAEKSPGSLKSLQMRLQASRSEVHVSQEKVYTDEESKVEEQGSFPLGVQSMEPLKYKSPQNFEAEGFEKNPQGALWYEDVNSEDTELWLVRAPVGVDVRLLANKRLFLEGMQNIGPLGSVGKFVKISTLFPSKRQRKMCVAGPAIKGQVSIVQSVVVPPVVMPGILPPGPMLLPNGLKPRFRPFGADSPERTDREQFTKIKHKKRKHSTEEEPALTEKSSELSEVSAVDDLTIHKNKKKKKTKKRHSDQTWAGETVKLPDESTDVHETSKKKKRKHADRDFVQAEKSNESLEVLAVKESVIHKHKKKKKRRHSDQTSVQAEKSSESLEVLAVKESVIHKHKKKKKRRHSDQTSVQAEKSSESLEVLAVKESVIHKHKKKKKRRHSDQTSAGETAKLSEVSTTDSTDVHETKKKKKRKHADRDMDL